MDMFASNDDFSEDDDMDNNKQTTRYPKNWDDLTAFEEFRRNTDSPSSRHKTNDLSPKFVDNFANHSTPVDPPTELSTIKGFPKSDASIVPQDGETIDQNSDELSQPRNQRNSQPSSVRSRVSNRSSRKEDNIPTSESTPDNWTFKANDSVRDRHQTSTGISDTRSDPGDQPVSPKSKGVKFEHVAPKLTKNTGFGKPVLQTSLPSLQHVNDNKMYANGPIYDLTEDETQPKHRQMQGGIDNLAYESSEDDSETESPTESQEVSIHQQLKWDVFRAYQYDTDLYACEGFFSVVQRIFRVLFIIISFLLILAAIVVSKLTLLFATSNMNLDVGFRKNFGTCKASNYTGSCKIGIISPSDLTTEQCGVPVEYDDPTLRHRDVIRWMWCMWMCMCLPYLITFVHCMWKIFFKQKKSPTCQSVAFVMFMEAVHVGGLMLLFYVCLPGVDIFRGLFLFNATALYPSFFKLFIRPRAEKNKGGQIFGDILSFLFQLAFIVLYICITFLDPGDNSSTYACSADRSFANTSNADPRTVTYTRCGAGQEKINSPKLFLIPVALFLTSFGWWQVFLGKDLKMSCAKGINRLNKQVKKGKTKLFAIVSIWKIIFSFAVFLVLGKFYHLGDVYEFSTLFGLNDNVFPFNDHSIANNQGSSFESDWLVVFGINGAAGLLCYIISLHAIQARTQQITYSIAITVATPVTFVIALYAVCIYCNNLASNMNLYWNCYDGFNNMIALLKMRPLTLAGFAIWISQLILGRHLWNPKVERLAKPGRIFLQPYYCGLLLEQSLVYNRSRNEKYRQMPTNMPNLANDFPAGTTDLSDLFFSPLETTRPRADTDREEIEAVTKPLAFMNEPLFDRPDRSQPMIFICATMWHENEQEMIQMIKSIMRLDMDQCIRRLTRDFFDIRVEDFYDFEAHIFFDDAFEKHVEGDPIFKVNRFVEQFVKVIDSAASFVHKTEVKLDPPIKVPTPYGGKLIYTLPGNNLLTIHLKDKQKIRHRKRWSQVMYMYYLFGYRLWNNPIARRTKELVAYNTYVLTLDGDVDFKPEAVLMLVDLMKRNYSVGAACGRIHPEGNGPMVWYQKFEYAISHWLQKTTEHILGCVLCSPGCFSLFRASALMDDNIMKTYSKTPENAVEHLQYDQGEDRWLCTLLLQRGYRVEYSAAADALTFAPEGFNEFFNQRRRWTPSTFANILDLLASGRQTAARNENISFLYIVYQGGLFASSVLGPGTIFLMTVSAFSSVFDTLSPTGAFFMAFAPLVVFFILCLFAPSKYQLGFAAILSGLFAIAQMVVFVGIIIGVVDDGLCSPTTWFLLATSGIFLMSAILHPREFTNILHGLLYFLAIPTMYLLLIIYAMCNLHVVSWGTREVVQTKAEQQRLKNRQMELNKQQQGGISAGFTNMFNIFSSDNKEIGTKEDGWTVSCGTCCRCLCCPRPGESPTDEAIRVLGIKIDSMRNKLENSDSSSDEDTETTPLKRDDHNDDNSESSSESSREEEPFPDYIDARIPYWTSVEDSVKGGPVQSVSTEENHFWSNLIKRYLQPIDKNPEREERIAKDLKNLRNKSVIGFFMLDLIFIVLFQTLQTIPDGGGTPGSGAGGSYFVKFNCTDPIKKTRNEQQLEPIGFAFLLVFGLFLVIQFFGMLFHRLFSLLQIVSTTTFGKEQKKHKEYLELTKNFFNDSDSVEVASIASSRRSSFADDNLHSQKISRPKNFRRFNATPNAMRTMDKTFAHTFIALKREIDNIPESEIIDAPPIPPRNRLFSLFDNRRPSMSPAHQVSSALARRNSVHANVIRDIAQRRGTIFAENRTDLIRQQYNTSENQIRRASRRISVLPDLQEMLHEDSDDE